MQKISKKIIICLLAVILVFSFAACTTEVEDGQEWAQAERTPDQSVPPLAVERLV